MQIRQLELEDLNWLVEQRNNEDLNIYFNQPHLINCLEQEKWYRDNVVTNKFYSFILWKKDTERVGYVSLKNFNPIIQKAEFSIFSLPEFQNKGYGKELIDFIIRFGFGRLNLNKIYSTVFEFNPAIEIYKRWGFKIDGKLRADCYKKGRYWDSYYVSMLKGDYERLYNSKQSAVSETSSLQPCTTK